MNLPEYQSMSQESFLVKMKLMEYKRMISVMSDSQLRTEMKTLETLKTQVMQQQEDEAANNRELHAASKQEREELEDQRRKKRQFIRLKETVEAPTQHGRIAPSLATVEALELNFPDLETLASLKNKGRHAVNIDAHMPDKKRMLTCKITDEILACQTHAIFDWPANACQTHAMTCSHDAKAIASRARAQAKAQVQERLRQQKLES